MGVLTILNSLLLLLFAVQSTALTASRGYSQPLEFPKARQLSAATLNSKLNTRGNSLSGIFNREASFDYVYSPEDHDTGSLFTATLDVESKWPILVLEDIESELNAVACSNSKIHLAFTSLERLTEAQARFEEVSDFVLVTSHYSCDSPGERGAYLVKQVTFDPINKVAVLQKEKYPWQDAFHSTQVSFSRRHYSEIQKRADTFAERQQESSPSSTTIVMTGGSTPTVSFLVVSATSNLPSTATKVLNKTYIDEVIFPPQVPVADQFIPQGVTVSCKNCSLEGTIELSKGSFNISGSDSMTEDITNTVDFFEHGSIELLVNELFAQIELGLDISESHNLLSLPISLPTIPLSPFEIPGAVAFGPLIQPQLNVSLDLGGEMGFSYGFNVSVPDNSKFVINMTELSNSSITGFDETTFHALPLQSKSALVSLILSASFTPQILLGISTSAGFVSGGIGAFLELPKLSVNVTQLSNVNENCEAVSDNTNDGVSSALDNVFGNLTSIVPLVETNMGVLAEFEVDISEFSDKAAAQYVLASTSYPLPTACLQFDQDSKQYVTPSKSTASFTATGTSGATVSDASKKGSATPPVGRPDLVSACALLITLVAIGFCGLA